MLLILLFVLSLALHERGIVAQFVELENPKRGVSAEELSAQKGLRQTEEVCHEPGKPDAPEALPEARGACCVLHDACQAGEGAERGFGLGEETFVAVNAEMPQRIVDDARRNALLAERETEERVFIAILLTSFVKTRGSNGATIQPGVESRKVVIGIVRLALLTLRGTSPTLQFGMLFIAKAKFVSPLFGNGGGQSADQDGRFGAPLPIGRQEAGADERSVGIGDENKAMARSVKQEVPCAGSANVFLSFKHSDAGDAVQRAVGLERHDIGGSIVKNENLMLHPTLFRRENAELIGKSANVGGAVVVIDRNEHRDAVFESRVRHEEKLTERSLETKQRAKSLQKEK